MFHNAQTNVLIKKVNTVLDCDKLATVILPKTIALGYEMRASVAKPATTAIVSAPTTVTNTTIGFIPKI